MRGKEPKSQHSADEQLAYENEELRRLLNYARRRIHILLWIHALLLFALAIWVIHQVCQSASIATSSEVALDILLGIAGSFAMPRIAGMLFARNFSRFQRLSSIMDMELNSERFSPAPPNEREY